MRLNAVVLVGALGIAVAGCDTGSRHGKGTFSGIAEFDSGKGLGNGGTIDPNGNGDGTGTGDGNGIISGIAPSQGSPSGGTVVTIHGNGFTDSGTHVFFGTNQGQNVTVNSPNELTVESPAGNGLVDVSVRLPNGTEGRLNNAFLYTNDGSNDPNQPLARVADYGDPSAEEQECLELMNRARNNPTAEGQRLGLDFSQYQKRPPLTHNEFLGDAATAHTEDMAKRSFYDHVNPDGDNANGRILDTNYELNDDYGTDRSVNYTESIGVATGNQFNTPQKIVDAFLRDEGVNPPKHREAILGKGNLMEKARDTGISVDLDQQNAQFEHYVAMEMARTKRDRPYVTGVVYTDSDNDGVARVGEFKAGVPVYLTHSSGFSLQTTTKSAGGYAFEFFKDGTYTIEIEGNKTDIVINGSSVKVDSASGTLVTQQ